MKIQARRQAAETILSSQTARRTLRRAEDRRQLPAWPPDILLDYIRVQVCDLQRTLRTQPCIFSEAPLIDALPL